MLNVVNEFRELVKRKIECFGQKRASWFSFSFVGTVHSLWKKNCHFLPLQLQITTFPSPIKPKKPYILSLQIEITNQTLIHSTNTLILSFKILNPKPINSHNLKLTTSTCRQVFCQYWQTTIIFFFLSCFFLHFGTHIPNGSYKATLAPRQQKRNLYTI